MTSSDLWHRQFLRGWPSTSDQSYKEKVIFFLNCQHYESLQISFIVATLERFSQTNPHVGLQNAYYYLHHDIVRLHNSGEKPQDHFVHPHNYDYLAVKISSQAAQLCGEKPQDHFVHPHRHRDLRQELRQTFSSFGKLSIITINLSNIWKWWRTQFILYSRCAKEISQMNW